MSTVRKLDALLGARDTFVVAGALVVNMTADSIPESDNDVCVSVGLLEVAVGTDLQIYNCQFKNTI